MNYFNKCLVYAFLIFLPNQFRAQIEGPLVSYFSRDLYAAGTQNWDIAMNSQGLVYFGNNKGLLEYDGNEWYLYHLPNRTIVRSIDIDSLGNIYVGGQNEIGVFRNDSGKVMKYESLTHLIPDSHNDFEDVWKIFSIKNQRIFCSEKEVFVIAESDVQTVLPESGRFENYFMVENKVYLQDSETGLFELNAGKLKRVLVPELYGNDRIVGIHRLARKVVVVTRENGIFELANNSLVEIVCEADQFLEDNKAYTTSLLKSGELAIGTVLNGLITIDSEGSITESLNKSNGLENNTILCASEDSSGNLWLGLDNGINHIELNSPFNFINSINGLEGTGYTAFKKDGVIYLGTNQGLYSNKSGNQDYELISNKASQIWGHYHLDGTDYIHSHEGTYILKDDELEPISDVQGAWKMVALKKRPGVLLQGTYEGFFVYKKKEGKAPVLIGQLTGFSESSRIFEEDDDGNIWISHAYRGLYRIKLNKAGDEIIEVRKYNSSHGLPDDLYLTVSKVRGEIVFTTSEGIYEFDQESESFRLHKGLSDLIGNDENVLRIMEDQTGNVWFCTDKEFGRISIQPNGVYNEVEISYLNEIREDLVDGFEDVFMINQSIAYIPVESGFIKYDTRKLLNKDFDHELIFRGIYLDGNGDSLISASLNYGDRIELNADQNNLTFNYVVPSYQNLNSIYYQYRLIGLDDEWSDWVTTTQREFNNLKSGNYSFRVRAMNSYETETSIVEFTFSILPPWYLSTLAKALYLIVFVLSLIVFYRVVKMREVKKRLEFQEESEETIQKKEAELKRISEKSESEIMKLRNEKLRADIGHKNSELASTTMHLVQKSEILLKIKKDLSDIVKTTKDDNLQVKIKQIERAIDADVRLDKNWERFESHFDQVHENFFKNLREQFPNLTPKDQKLCAYLRMNLSTKEIAPLLNISVRGVEISRYRLRKKLDLQPDDNLVSFIMDV